MGHPKARKPAAERPARRLHGSAKAGKLTRPEAYCIQSTCLSIYDGRTCIGHLPLRGKVGVEAFAANDRSLGVYPNRKTTTDAATGETIKAKAVT